METKRLAKRYNFNKMEELLQDGKLFSAGMRNDWKDSCADVTLSIIKDKTIQGLSHSFKDFPSISFDNGETLEDMYIEEWIHMWFIFDKKNNVVSEGFTTEDGAKNELVTNKKYNIRDFHRIDQIKD